MSVGLVSAASVGVWCCTVSLISAPRCMRWEVSVMARDWMEENAKLWPRYLQNNVTSASHIHVRGKYSVYNAGHTALPLGEKTSERQNVIFERHEILTCPLLKRLVIMFLCPVLRLMCLIKRREQQVQVMAYSYLNLVTVAGKHLAALTFVFHHATNSHNITGTLLFQQNHVSDLYLQQSS